MSGITRNPKLEWYFGTIAIMNVEESHQHESCSAHEVHFTYFSYALPVIFRNYTLLTSAFWICFFPQICNDDMFDPLEFMLETSMKEENVDLDFTETSENSDIPVLLFVYHNFKIMSILYIDVFCCFSRILKRLRTKRILILLLCSMKSVVWTL